MIYVKSFLTGLAAVFAAVFLTGISLFAWWMSSSTFFIAVRGSLIAGPVLTGALLTFAAGFFWQYQRLSHKG